MPIVDAFSPAILSKIEEKGRFANQACKAVSPFAKFDGPDGNYFSRLRRISSKWNSKKNCISVTATFMTIAYCENSSEEFAGRTINQTYNLVATEKKTEQENWDRMYTELYQNLGCLTANWPNLGKPIGVILQEETRRLNAERPAVVLSVNKSAEGGAFGNIREILRLEAIAQFQSSKIELTDEQVDQSIDEGVEQLDESVVTNFKPTFEKAEKTIRDNQDTASLTAFVTKSGITDFPSDAVLQLGLADLQTVALYCYVKKAGHLPSDFGLELPAVPVSEVDRMLAQAKTVQTAASPAVPIVPDSPLADLPGRTLTEKELQSLTSGDVGDVGAVLGDMLEESIAEISEIEEIVEVQDPLAGEKQVYADHLRKLDRNGIKVAIRAMDPNSQFRAAQADDDLRAIAFDLKFSSPPFNK